MSAFTFNTQPQVLKEISEANPGMRLHVRCIPSLNADLVKMVVYLCLDVEGLRRGLVSIFTVLDRDPKVGGFEPPPLDDDQLAREARALIATARDRLKSQKMMSQRPPGIWNMGEHLRGKKETCREN